MIAMDQPADQPINAGTAMFPERLVNLYHRRTRKWFDRPHKPLVRILNKLYSMWAAWIYPFAFIGRKTSIHYTCDLRNPFLIHLGDHVLVDKDVWLSPVLPDERKDGPTIVIEDNCLIARRVQISARNRVHLKKNVLLSASVLITDNSHEYQKFDSTIDEQGFMRGGTVEIGEGCWIGHGAAIVCTQGDLVLGCNCVVAANALVTKSFPPYSVVSGNPARIVKQYDPDKGHWILGSVPRLDPGAPSNRAPEINSR